MSPLYPAVGAFVVIFVLIRLLLSETDHPRNWLKK